MNRMGTLMKINDLVESASSLAKGEECHTAIDWRRQLHDTRDSIVKEIGFEAIRTRVK